MKLIAFTLALIISGVVAYKTCSIVQPTVKDFQVTVADFLSAIQGDNTQNIGKTHDEALAKLDLNVTYTPLFYATLKDFRQALKTETRSCESMNEITEKKNAYIKAGEKFLGSQKGLENFLTDQCKRDDPFLKEFYKFHKGLVAGADRLAIDPCYKDKYFEKENADVFAKFTMVLAEIVARENALEEVKNNFLKNKRS